MNLKPGDDEPSDFLQLPSQYVRSVNGHIYREINPYQVDIRIPRLTEGLIHTNIAPV
jgi:hypothetical protein